MIVLYKATDQNLPPLLKSYIRPALIEASKQSPINDQMHDIWLKDPEAEHRSAMIGLSPCNHLVFVCTYGDLQSLLMEYGAEKAKIMAEERRLDYPGSIQE